jgi:hypothetical protein
MTDIKDVKNVKQKEPLKEIQPNILEIWSPNYGNPILDQYLVSEDKEYEKIVYRIRAFPHGTKNTKKSQQLSLQHTFSHEDFLVSIYNNNEIGQILRYSVLNAQKGAISSYTDVSPKNIQLYSNGSVFKEDNNKINADIKWSYYQLSEKITLTIQYQKTIENKMTGGEIFYLLSTPNNQLYGPLTRTEEASTLSSFISSQQKEYKQINVVIMVNQNELLQGFIGTLTGYVELHNTAYNKDVDLYIITGPIIGVFELRYFTNNAFYISMETRMNKGKIENIGEVIRSSFIPFYEKQQKNEYPVIDKDSNVLTYVMYYDDYGTITSQKEFFEIQAAKRQEISKVLIADLIQIVQGY